MVGLNIVKTVVREELDYFGREYEGGEGYKEELQTKNKGH